MLLPKGLWAFKKNQIQDALTGEQGGNRERGSWLNARKRAWSWFRERAGWGILAF